MHKIYTHCRPEVFGGSARFQVASRYTKQRAKVLCVGNRELMSEHWKKIGRRGELMEVGKERGQLMIVTIQRGKKCHEWGDIGTKVNIQFGKECHEWGDIRTKVNIQLGKECREWGDIRTIQGFIQGHSKPQDTVTYIEDSIGGESNRCDWLFLSPIKMTLMKT